MRALAFALPASLLLFATACAQTDKVDVDDEGVNEGHQAIDEYVNGIADLDLAPAQPKTQNDCQGDQCPQDGQEGAEWCTYKHYTETAHYEKFVAFQPNSATLWPGVVVRGADAQEGLLTPVGVDLAPVTFSLSLENIANSPVGFMDAPSLSAFRDARNQILEGGVTGATPASLDFNIIEVHSQSQIATALGGGINWPGGAEVAASFDFSVSNKKTKILVNFTQSYYTIDVDAPTTPKDFFDPNVTVDDLLPYVDPASPPLYVQSITFGRRVLFSVETDESATAIKAALEAAYKGAVDVNAKVSTEHQAMLQSSNIKAFVLGGSGGEATGAVSGYEGLLNYIKNGGNYSKESPGAPIAYKLAYLDNAATTLAFTTEYSERECTKNQGTLRADLTSIDAVSGGDAGSNLEFYGYVTLRYPTVNGGNVTCTGGGKAIDIWRIDEGSWISVQENSTWTPSAPEYVVLNDVPFGDQKAICLSAEIWEEDYSTGELSGDDDFGHTSQLILYQNGWEGEHTLHLSGGGSNAVDVSVKITLE